MFEFNFQKWFDIFLELIEFPTNFRSSTHLNFIKTIRLEREKMHCALGLRRAWLLTHPTTWAGSAWAGSPLSRQGSPAHGDHWRESSEPGSRGEGGGWHLEHEGVPADRFEWGMG
jgi:hypothetical protein